MIVIRAIQILGLCLSLGAFLLLGHQYYSAMTAPAGNTARFVSANGEVSRPAQGSPTFIESTKVFFAGLLGAEEKTGSGLSALQTRTRVAQISEQDRTMREIEFWTGFTSKLGFSGP